MQQTKKFKMADAISPYLAVSCGLTFICISLVISWYAIDFFHSIWFQQCHCSQQGHTDTTVICLNLYWQWLVTYLASSHWQIQCLTHWGRDRMAAIFQMTCWSGFLWMKMHEFRLRFHWSLFLGVQLIIFQLGSDNGLSPTRRQAIIWTNDGLGYRHINVLHGLNELTHCPLGNMALISTA